MEFTIKVRSNQEKHLEKAIYITNQSHILSKEIGVMIFHMDRALNYFKELHSIKECSIKVQKKVKQSIPSFKIIHILATLLKISFQVKDTLSMIVVNNILAVGNKASFKGLAHTLLKITPSIRAIITKD